jgi:tetratricopeptide (TPR) repeat protein
MKFYWACIFLCSTFLARAGDSRVADSLFAAGNFSRAALEYERVFFTDTSMAGKNMALLHRSQCFKNQNNFSEAYNTLKRVQHIRMSDTLDQRIRHEKALCAYLSSQYEDAEYELQQMDFFDRDTLLTAKSLFLKVLVLNELEKWDSTKRELKRYFAYKKIDPDTLNVDALIPPQGLRKPRTALLLSLFLPGSGQVYAGKPGRALASIALQGAALTFGIISIMHGYYFEGAFTGVSLFLRFYSGGARHAAYLVEKRNEKRNDAVKEKIKNIILHCEGLS